MARVKTIFGGHLFARNFEQQATESFIKVRALKDANLCADNEMKDSLDGRLVLKSELCNNAMPL